MRMHSGFHCPDTGFPAAKVVDWISVPLGVATLRDQFRDVEDDSARFALMSWFFEENLAEFAPYKDEQVREAMRHLKSGDPIPVSPTVAVPEHSFQENLNRMGARSAPSAPS